MKQKNALFMMECHLAGRMYHDANEVFDELKVGTPVYLCRDIENRYDEAAVAVYYYRGEEEFLLGYIPREENQTLALFLEMGWSDLFQAFISQINPLAHYEQQIRLTIRVRRNPDYRLSQNK